MTFTDLQYSIPHDPASIAAYMVAAVLLIIGLGKIISQSRRNARLRNEVSRKNRDVAHLRAVAMHQAKMHEADSRNY